jgi:hypothetical protein
MLKKIWKKVKNILLFLSVSCVSMPVLAYPHLSKSHIDFLRPQTEKILIQITKEVEEKGFSSITLLPKDKSSKSLTDVKIVAEVISEYVKLREEDGWIIKEEEVKKGAILIIIKGTKTLHI